MKAPLISLATAVLCTLAVLPARADILSPNMDAKDTIGLVNSLETKNGLSAQFWMTTDEEIFSTFSRSGAIRGMKPVIQVKRSTPVFLAIFLANPGVRSVTIGTDQTLLSSDVTFDLYLVSPAGVLSLANKQRSAWKGTPPTPGLVTLAKDRGVLNFEAIDASGEYTVVVILHDNVRKIDMKLARKLELID